jgi:hypothetical protein
MLHAVIPGLTRNPAAFYRHWIPAFAGMTSYFELSLQVMTGFFLPALLMSVFSHKKA